MSKDNRPAAMGRLIAFAVIGWCLAVACLFYLSTKIKGFQDLGQFGDSFGAINALVSACGFAALYHTIQLQQREISDADTDRRKGER